MEFVSKRKLLGEWPRKIVMAGTEFTFVTQQRDLQSAIYGSENAYLRIGDAERIRRDLTRHQTMEAAGFPIATLLGKGVHEGKDYFMESSLGQKHFGNLFAEEVTEKGVISADTVEQFMAIVEKYARAQLPTQKEGINYEEFAKGILLKELCTEMPENADKLKARFEQVKNNLGTLPLVLTHGDFNPNNLYPKGVIDLEDSHYAPYGYDLVSAIVHIDSFPTSKEYEYYAKYRFTAKQIETFYEHIDTVFEEAHLPPLTSFKEDFAFCRAVWLAAGISNTPKLQEFRFNFIETLLKEFT